MDYKEFLDLHKVMDPRYPMIQRYQYEDGSIFYIEPVFYTKLLRFAERVPDRYQDILNEMERIVKKNKRVVFTGNFDMPFVDIEDFVYREITDITNALQIFVLDISRGSDYGD